MPFEPLDWTQEERLTASKLNKMSDNQKFLNDRKMQSGLRNMTPGRQPRGTLPIILDNLVMFAEYREISPGNKFPDEQIDKVTTPVFQKDINFPNGFFDPSFLPVVMVSIGAKSGIKNISHVINDVSYAGFTITIREHTGQNFTESMQYFVSYVAIGVKN